MNFGHIELLQEAFQHLEDNENLMGTLYLRLRQKLRLTQNAILQGRTYTSSEIKELCDSAYNAVNKVRENE